MHKIDVIELGISNIPCVYKTIFSARLLRIVRVLKLKVGEVLVQLCWAERFQRQSEKPGSHSELFEEFQNWAAMLNKKQ